MSDHTLTTKQVRDLAMEFIRVNDNNPVVCFDYFDTLATRVVAPQYTKQMAAFQLSRLLKNQISGKELYNIRYDLEASMCLENAKRGLDMEFNLKILGERLFDVIKKRGKYFLSRFSKDQFALIILDIEVAVEKLVQRPCLEMVSLLKSVKAKHATTVLISDFYLPAKNIIQLLHHHQMDEIFDHIYISADFCITKGGGGRLYDKIIRDLSIDRDKILMIGDNPHADSQMAKERGIKSLLLNRQNEKKFYQDWETNHNRKENRHQRTKNEIVATIRKHGGHVFPEMGLIIWWFIWKLLERLIHDDVPSVFFLSREGELLKKLFDKLQEEMFGRQIIKSNYLLASRKSTYIASLKPLPKEDFSKLFFQYRDISPKDFLLSLNFSHHQAMEICEHIGVNFNEKYHNFPETLTYKQIISTPLFKTSYERLRKKQRENFIRYISSSNPDIKMKEIHLVEVGWKGSIQENIFNIFKKHLKVTGYYIGLLSSPVQHRDLKKIGILFSEIPSSSFMSVYNNNRSLFEMFLGASHGSAEGYFSSRQEIKERNDASVEIHSEIKDDEGDLFVTTVEYSEEKNLYTKKIQPIQQKMSKIASILNHRFIFPESRLPGERFFAKQHGRMTFFPRKREIDFFERLYHLENFGVFEFTKFRPEEKVTLKRRLFNLKSVLVDPDILEIGFWPPVILRHLGIDFYRHIDGPRRAFKNFGISGLSCILPFY